MKTKWKTKFFLYYVYTYKPVVMMFIDNNEVSDLYYFIYVPKHVFAIILIEIISAFFVSS